ncbi:MAG: HAMP domain-containing histidine kinase [Lachnospiraceae bacterium]|nr:HAMP domain-containing histidine kinase [Lachnospiraceae bacterium]
MKKLFNSLRFRFLICFLLVGIIPVVLLHVLVVNTYENSLINKRMVEIKQRCNVIGNSLGEYSSIQMAMTPEMTNVLNWYSDAYGGRLMVVDSRYKVLLDTYYADTGKSIISDAVFSAFLGKEYESFQSSTNFLEFVVPVMHSGSGGKVITSVLVFSSTTDWIQESLSRVKQAMLLIEIIMLVVMTVLAIYISYLLTRPINTVAFEVEKLRVGHLDHDISQIRSYKEVDAIMESTSQVIDNYRKMEESQERFVSNVSHELRTPMASIRVLADSLIGQENVPEEMYQEFLSDISFEIDRESRIIDDLLSMSRLSHAEDSMNISTVNINEFVLNILKTLRPIAEKRNIEIVYESFRSVTADVDQMKLNQAFSNLIENAIKYDQDGGMVKVSLDADHEYFYFRVADNGIGIPEDALPRIFDRFYRVDKARSRETGGTGLGLSITKQIVLLHYGVIKAESKIDEGTTFTVRIPLKHVEEASGRKKA